MLPRMAEESSRLVWVDLEMTGLDPETCTIVEIATIVTDNNLAVIAEGPCLVVHQTDEVLAGMSSFVRDLHLRSGLLEPVAATKGFGHRTANKMREIGAKTNAKFDKGQGTAAKSPSTGQQ